MVIGTIALIILVVYGVRRHLEERRMDRQLGREGVSEGDLNSNEGS